MGTNYYLNRHCTAPCEHCNIEPLHIGKHSAGWEFGFRGHPELGIENFTDWRREIDKTRDIVQSLKSRGDSETEDLAVITDEYGWIIEPEKFIELVENSRKPRGSQNTRPRKRDHCRRDNEGWDFYDDEFS